MNLLTPVIKIQKTAYYVTGPDDASFRDETGHGWFTKAVAREHAKRIGGMYFDGNRTSIKEVVTGYTVNGIVTSYADATVV